MDKPRKEWGRGDFYKFDYKRFVKDLKKAKSNGYGKFPTFNIQKQEQEQDKIIYNSHIYDVVIVEGSYLFLEEEPWQTL